MALVAIIFPRLIPFEIIVTLSSSKTSTRILSLVSSLMSVASVVGIPTVWLWGSYRCPMRRLIHPGRTPLERWRASHLLLRGHLRHLHTHGSLLLEFIQKLGVVFDLCLDMFSSSVVLLATKWPRVLQIYFAILTKEVWHLYKYLLL